MNKSLIKDVVKDGDNYIVTCTCKDGTILQIKLSEQEFMAFGLEHKKSEVN